MGWTEGTEGWGCGMDRGAEGRAVGWTEGAEGWGFGDRRGTRAGAVRWTVGAEGWAVGWTMGTRAGALGREGCVQQEHAGEPGWAGSLSPGLPSLSLGGGGREAGVADGGRGPLDPGPASASSVTWCRLECISAPGPLTRAPGGWGHVSHVRGGETEAWSRSVTTCGSHGLGVMEPSD